MGCGIPRAWGGHLQHAEAVGVHVHRLVIVLLVHLGGHELRGACTSAGYSWTFQTAEKPGLDKAKKIAVQATRVSEPSTFGGAPATEDIDFIFIKNC